MNEPAERGLATYGIRAYDAEVGGIEIDTSNGFIWLLRFPETFRIEEYRQHFVDLRALNPEGQKIATIVDLRAMNPILGGIAVHREAARIMRANFSFLRETVVADVRVVPNPVTRGVLTVFDWLSAQPWAVNTVSSGPAAERWVRAQIEGAGYSAPAAPVWVTSKQARSAS